MSRTKSGQRRSRAGAEYPAIVTRGLSKTYPGGVQAVRGLDIEVLPGEVFGIVGPNGAGKSTTIGMLTTTIAPTAGSAKVGGFDVLSEPLQARRISSVVFQEPVVDGALTGRRNLDIHARLWGVDPRTASKRLAEAVTVLGLEGVVDRPLTTYSGGERRRLEIARALLSRPQVLFLDEPTTGLDTRIRHELDEYISRLRAEGGMAIVLTTHYLDEAERLCDRVAIIHEGRLVAMDSPSRLLSSLGPEIIEVRVEGDPSAAAATLRAERVAGEDAFVVGRTVTIPLHRRRASRALAVIDELELDVSSVSSRPPNLDDVYLRLTGDRLADAGV